MNEKISEKTISTADMAGRSQTRDQDGREMEQQFQPPNGGPPGGNREGNQMPGSDRPAERPVALLATDEAQRFQSRWDAAQIAFVDEPRTAVGEADTLVAELMQRLAELFAEERTQLEAQWSRGEDVSTEDLRLSLKRYRSFFHRLLAL
jgi:hypothetical protein